MFLCTGSGAELSGSALRGLGTGNRKKQSAKYLKSGEIIWPWSISVLTVRWLKKHLLNVTCENQRILIKDQSLENGELLVFFLGISTKSYVGKIARPLL